jgi:hypothetical protein
MFTLILVALAGIGVGYIVKHYLSAAQIASIEATLKKYENLAAADVQKLVAEIRAKLGL